MANKASEKTIDRPPEEVRFVSNAIGMAEAIYYELQKLHAAGLTTIEPNNVNMIIDLMKMIKNTVLIEEFISKSYQHWDKIKEKEESFFLENAGDIFAFLPPERVKAFTNLFHTKDHNGKCIVRDKLKEILWNHLHGMVKICIQYVYKNKKTIENEVILSIDVQKHATTWGLKL